ncbi:uncharacterized protein STEHIDRAFT_169304 [Stereum hirsutum FP-91666 SS1]|uniref:uncharacterized protein n=1 Tax=Stereum hirsutum (strain FP-91666) TaxID=721885 RepID=UPI0004449272|nr:uncharacterized protein STEHIDRAFT_169304 [Stereum hirsutum FP-91666 SS1]EIM85338.1 hypothetical protein STEHIDRAFT_169304 [Stereum hirsutum FP-91666 SS1]
MFFRSILAVALSAAAFVYAVDNTREVYTPNGESSDIFCRSWDASCTTVVGNTGTSYVRCGDGYDGAGTARVDCLSVSADGSSAVDYTDANVQALGLTYVA